MSILNKKKILLGVSGSIAAYKCAFLVRLLVKEGAEVKVLMTPSAGEFITPLTLATLSTNPVHSDFTEDKHEGTWVNHVELGLWADLMIIAPATANTLSKMVTGNADNLLLAVYLSARCQVAIAPAMDLDMYSHASTTANLNTLEQREHLIIEPGSGELASGLIGKGRMAEPEEIIQFTKEWFLERAPFHGKKATVTAGPTYEAIDAVRFIGNHSSGRMGMAIANELTRKGATVTLICGPTQLQLQDEQVHRIDVTTAEEMKIAALESFKESSIFVMSAAVADYRPKNVVASKIKKSTASLSIELEATPDILKELGSRKQKGQLLVGFALETDDEVKNAQGKLERKNLDLIILNSLNDEGAGFGHATNKITMIDRSNKMASFELKTKEIVAKDIVEKILTLCD
ncbi:MAG: phosphopantothenoylcysteine decarboxylase/phosphopantothenate--cysteine ligase [Flavobacteriales bacterium]|jgi:phosphopantothenoylcysteine decarboxylase/phosphopantothenate--cysteine ligase